MTLQAGARTLPKPGCLALHSHDAGAGTLGLFALKDNHVPLYHALCARPGSLPPYAQNFWPVGPALPCHKKPVKPLTRQRPSETRGHLRARPAHGSPQLLRPACTCCGARRAEHEVHIPSAGGRDQLLLDHVHGAAHGGEDGAVGRRARRERRHRRLDRARHHRVGRAALRALRSIRRGVKPWKCSDAGTCDDSGSAAEARDMLRCTDKLCSLVQTLPTAG